VVGLRVEWEVFTGAAREDLYTPKDRCCLVSENSIVNSQRPSPSLRFWLLELM
jgi:hypothetical protein